MSLVAALIYWVIVASWLIVLAAVCVAIIRNPRTFGIARALLMVLAVDTARNIIENFYFGLYFGAQYGLFPGAIAGVLGRPYLLIIPKLLNVGAAFGVFGLLLTWVPRAIKEREEAQRNLDKSEQRFGLLVDGVKEYAIYTLDPSGCVTSWNRGAQRIKGYSATEVIGSHVSRFYTEADQSAGAPARALAIAEREGSYETEALRTKKDGTTFWAHVVINAIRDDADQLIGFAKVTKDITEAKRAEQELRHLAHFDQLTGLPNRTSLLHDLDLTLSAVGTANSRRISIALFDLDGFKDINDALGHTMGDRLLQQVGHRFSAAADGGRVYRLGGDEFVLTVAKCGDPLVMSGMVESLLKAIEPRFEIEGHHVFVGASAGIAISSEPGLSSSALIEQADLALYEAKDTGGRRARLFMPSMRAKAEARHEIDTELRRASANNEFELYFQPEIRLRDGALVGAEALLRWRHPQRGLLSPAAFIEALAQSPVALEVGNWVMQSACAAAASWRGEGYPSFRIGVNLFPAQFNAGLLVGDVEAALQRAGLSADGLELEITENIALGRDDGILPSLRKLRTMGVGIALDDFGTGYASLSYLTRFPLTRIKIDRSFVQSIRQNSSLEETAIVRSMIVLGHNLGLEVIAEGVEVHDQVVFLAAEGCDEVQGYLHGKPLPAAEFEQMLEHHRERNFERIVIRANLAG